MSVKRSAFSVFQEKKKNPSSCETPDTYKTSDNEFEIKSSNSKKSQQSTPSTGKLQRKAEEKLDSIRKSLRRKKKKESHHDVSLKDGQKESKLNKAGSYLQVFGSSNWTENIENLNSSSLEAAFLPEVVKQKKEQKNLHENKDNDKKEQLRSKSTSEIQNTDHEPVSRKRTASQTFKSVESQKPPMPKKKRDSPSKKESKKRPKSTLSLSSQSSLEENSLDQEEQAKNISDAEKLFAWVISPIKPKQFFVNVWQKKPLFIKRRQPKYNNVWFSTTEFDRILRQQVVQFTKNLDIAVYRNGKRETLNPDGRAFAPIVWKFYEEGCSVRLLNPQTFSKNVWQLTSRLQEYFGCFVGTNVYLTPPGSQGFAPHYDDIEAFVIQLEGKKRWRLYPSRNMNEVLARNSSANLSEEDLGEPVLDRVLEPGDTLYFPRGVIHQGVTEDNSHSLHITLSFCQKNCWSDFMEKLIPMALQTAIEEDIEFRKALPVGYHQHVGIAHSEKSTDERKSFMKTVEELMKKLVSYVAVDKAADETVLDQMEEYLPPCLTSDENDCSIHGNGAFFDGGRVRGTSTLSLQSEVRLIRPGIVRLVSDEETLQIYETVDNSREYKERPIRVLEVPIEMADATEFLLFSYPDYVKLEDIPLDDDDDKLSLALKLYDAGLIRTKTPLTQDSLI